MGTGAIREQERQENREKRLQMILDMGRDLFISKGLARVSMKDIAEKAQISRATLYRYFPSKEDLALAIEQHLFRDLLQPEYRRRILKAQGSGLEKVSFHLDLVIASFKLFPDYYKFTGAFDHYFNFSQKPQKLATEMRRIFAEGDEEDPLLNFMKEGIQDGSIRSDLDPDMTTKTIDQTLLSLCQRIASREEELEIELDLAKPELMLDNLVKMILDSLQRS